MSHPSFMIYRCTLLFLFAACRLVEGQTYWQPDSTGYNYLSRGASLQQWVAAPGTKVEIDRHSYLTAGGSIKWTIPANRGVATLELRLIDLDLRHRVIYTTCRRNNHPAAIELSLLTTGGKVFKLSAPVEYNEPGAHLAVEAWHQRGLAPWAGAVGNATRADLRHVNKIVFTAGNADIAQVLWIDEIKYTRPRGPVGIINFNHYRDNADSLLTPWLIANGYPANIDFTYDYARRRLSHHRANGGLLVRYIGLDRIAALVNKHGWSTTHHGTFYKDLRQLTPAERQQLYALDPFVQAGFMTQWCFSIPMDWATPELFAEIQSLKRFYAVRNQWDRLPNELPIDNPMRLRFYRISSAAAGPNIPGYPETPAQMRTRVYEVFKRKGLLILNFDSVVKTPSPNYQDVEFSLLREDQALIKYADSLGFTFLTFKDLFAPDPNYRQPLSLNPDYFQTAPIGSDTLQVLKNDLGPAKRNLRIVAISQPQSGQAKIVSNGKAILHAPAMSAGIQRFYYVATDGVLTDTAWVFITDPSSTSVQDRLIPTEFTLYQNYPNPFHLTTVIEYELTTPSPVRLEIFSVEGRRVATLVNTVENAGIHTVQYDAKKLGNGVYFYKLISGEFVKTMKMVVMR